MAATASDAMRSRLKPYSKVQDIYMRYWQLKNCKRTKNVQVPGYNNIEPYPQEVTILNVIIPYKFEGVCILSKTTSSVDDGSKRSITRKV